MSLVQPPPLVSRDSGASPARASEPQQPGPRVVAIGGGTGLAVTLAGLKAALQDDASGAGRGSLCAVVSVADDGGSSGRLRLAYPIVAPGDIRNCLVALADGDPLLKSLFDYRFEGDDGVGGHSLGNLILTALTSLSGTFPRAVELAAALLGIRGRVLPCTAEAVGLVAELADGRQVCGECQVGRAGSPIRRIGLDPAEARALPEVLQVLESAELVVLGPGSLYTSIIPVLLVRGIADAMAGSAARVVLVCNLMTEPGETDGYAASDMVRALVRHVPALRIHHVLANTLPVAAAVTSAAPVPIDADLLASLGCEVTGRELLGADPRVRHDPLALGRALLELAPARRDVGAA